MQEGDVFLLCSDGLCDMVEADEIRDFILECPALQAACSGLEGMILENGGNNNVTVILVSV